MTNPTQHGQVPEALIDLIDAYAETRHRCGGIYNAKTEAARKAVIEALSGMQALSAAPVVPTSVKGAMWFTKKPVTIQAIQWTGENLREVITFTDGSPDTRSHHAGMAWDAYRDLVARDGLKIYTLEGKMLASPGDWIIRGVKGELYPCKPDIFQETYAAVSPTPPAEQQAQPGAVYAELPDSVAWLAEYGGDVFTATQLLNFADRTHALRMEQAAPKAAPAGFVPVAAFDRLHAHAESLAARLLAVSPTPQALSAGPATPPAEQQAAPKAAPGEPDYSEKWDAELGRTAMRFVDRAGDVHPGIDDAETICAEFHRAMSEVIERMPHVQRMAAPQQEAQEPVAWQSRTRPTWGGNTRPWSPWEPCTKEQAEDCWKTPLLHDWAYEARALFTAPQPAPAPLSDDTERLEWLLWKLPGDALRYVVGELADTSSGAEFRAAIDATIAAQGGK